jgi:uncharacterized protein
MKIWVDADACPQAVRKIVITAATKREIATVFVANKPMLLPQSTMVSFVGVPPTADAADQYIAEHAEPGDLVVTADIPLAGILVKKSVVAIDPRGVKYSDDNIGDRLAVRDLMQTLRDGGEIRGGPKEFGDKDKQAFAATFDRELTRLLRSSI